MANTVLVLEMVLSAGTRWHQHPDISLCHLVNGAGGLLQMVMSTVVGLMNV
jgi:hypothetical protein